MDESKKEPQEQADGTAAWPTFANHGEEVAAAVVLLKQERSAAETYTCWGCGREFVTKDARQRECVRCYVEGKL